MKNANSACLERKQLNNNTPGQPRFTGPAPRALEIMAGRKPGSQVHQVNPRLSHEHDQVMQKLLELYADLFWHDGFGNISIEMKFLKKGQKEIIISSGKDYRFVVDWPEPAEKV